MALITGVVHAGLAPALSGGDVRPNLILGAVVVLTALFGLSAGALWAFLGGLAANLLTTDQLGTIPLGLLVAVAAVVGVRRVAGERGVLAVVVGAVMGSLALDLVAVVGLYLTDPQAAGPRLSWVVDAWLPTAAVNAVVAVVLWMVARAVVGRFGPEPLAA